MAMVSSSSATVAVEKATSDLLISPDWTMNIDICDSVNSNNWFAKDVVKAVKKRLQHKSPKVQLLALTLLETMVKNCGDYVHFQIAEKNILGEMVKIVKKKTDMHVRDKILVLLDSWQEAFGGPGGKHPQYYWAYEDLRRSGVEFPQRSLDAAPIMTPCVTQSASMHAQPGYGMPSNSSRRLDETMATEIEGLSLSSLESMRNVMELLSDMLQAVNPRDCEALKDEVIVDLINRCRSNQKMLMQMLTTTGDEELLGQGLELNDSLQMVLAQHDAISSGTPMPTRITNSSPKSSDGCPSNVKPTEVRDSSPRPTPNPTASIANVTRGQINEEEEEDDFAQLARRHSKTHASSSPSTYGTSGALVSVETGKTTASMPADPMPTQSNALAIPDTPGPVRTSKEQDIIDFLSITLSTTTFSHPDAPPHTLPAANQKVTQMPDTSSTEGNTHVSHTYPGNQGQVSYNSYVVPWAQPEPQHQLQRPSQLLLQPQSQQQLQPQSHPQSQSHPSSQQQLQSLSQPQLQPQLQSQLPSHYPQYLSGYPPPPWAATPGYPKGQNLMSASSNMFSTPPRANTMATSISTQAASPSVNGDSRVNSGPRNPAPPGQKPFIPSYRLFEDLNVFGNADGRFKMASGTSSSLSGTSGQGMVGGRK